ALADLGTALDVLAQLPLINVQDGDICVTGRDNVEIYIDGHPMRDPHELRNMLSTSLNKVELLMAPGAAYRSTTDAVLKLTTRRSLVKGLSFTDRLTVQRRRRWSASEFADLTFRTGGWELFASGLVDRDNSLSKGSTVNTLIYEGKETLAGSTQHNSYPTTVGQVKGGVNYSAGTQSAGAYYLFSPQHGYFTNTGTEWVDDDPVLAREIDKTERGHSHLVSAYYDNTFAGLYHLHFDGDYRLGSERNRVVVTYPGAEAAPVNSADHSRSTFLACKLYLEFLLAKGNFTVGTQDSRTRTSLDYRMLNPQVGEYIPSSSTLSRQTSAALYASWERTFGRLSLTAGARYEYVDYDFIRDGCRDEDVSRRDHLVTPDMSLGYIFNDNSLLTLSYRPATVRPPYSRLTGSLSYVGMHEIEGGNPALRDERLHDMSLLGFWNGFMLSAGYMRSFDTYAYVKQLYPAPTMQLLMHPVNIDLSVISLCLAWSRPVGCWTPDIAVEMYRQWLTIETHAYDRPIISYDFDNTFALTGGWTLTLNLSGRTRGDMHTNRFGATPLAANASVGKTFLNKSLIVRLSATDIFNTANNDWTMNTCGVYVDKRQSYDRRGLTLGITYSFQPRRSAYRGRPAAESEQKRL
ncbi:MAG: outer membrane beta-barrel family protein, partial [Duncaniella sp.]|nr:outer membrane beta-barrel family protein [Duncaniella sp.]